MTLMVLELSALGFFTIGHMHVTLYACNTFLSPKAGPLVMASITPASSFLQEAVFSANGIAFKNRLYNK
jgi:hypothetical protein